MLFDQYELKGLTLINRFVRSATGDGMSDENWMATDRQLELFKELARGSIGLIVTGHNFVRADGIANAMNAIDSDDSIPSLRTIADAVHSLGPSKIVAQINHAGRNAPGSWDRKEVVAPSAIPVTDEAPVPRALLREEIEELAELYGDAAVRAREAGFDAVQVHGAHAWLVSQFLPL